MRVGPPGVGTAYTVWVLTGLLCHLPVCVIFPILKRFSTILKFRVLMYCLFQKKKIMLVKSKSTELYNGKGYIPRYSSSRTHHHPETAQFYIPVNLSFRYL